MRPLVELIVVFLVVYAGWHQPFKDHASALFPEAGIQPSRTAIVAQRTARMEAMQQANPQAAPNKAPQKSPSWMWSETSMDRPYK